MSSTLFKGNCIEVMKGSEYSAATKGKRVVIVTDPPFNIGYHYGTYKDNLKESAYFALMGGVLMDNPFVLIHYPETLYKLISYLGRFPNRVVSWCYNSNTAKQHRDIAFVDVVPDFSKVTQPYKNPKDKRIQKLIAGGKTGARLYDWWNIDQVKNVSKVKTIHPCQMPQKVMDNIIGILPKTEDLVVVDPFMGSGTTGLACQHYGVDFIGIEIDDAYFSTSRCRLGLSEQTEEVEP